MLKYRLNQTPADLEEFARPPAPRPATAPAGAPPAVAPVLLVTWPPGSRPQLADVNAAFALVRANAKKWHVDPDRIGMIGFSAGANAHHGDHP